ncbi:hypothetical protein B484DRAFT_191301 [Ochromonadaceae sp. CCMP2298]|nr:hypothetical protein B484DRAFT_191301 [Ochromonadaceae sp. CCMP2298]
MFVSFLQFLGLLRALFARPLSPSQPSPVPSAQPSSSPSAQPSAEPSTQPSSAPSSQPITAYLFEYLTVEYQLKMDARNILLIWVYILVTIVLLSMGTYYSYGWYGVPVGEMWLASEVWVKPVGAVVYSLLEKNPFVQVVIFGSLTAYAYVLANTLYRLLVLPLFTGLQCNVVIHNDDPNFNAIMDYVADSLLQSSSASYSLQANTKVGPAHIPHPTYTLTHLYPTTHTYPTTPIQYPILLHLYHIYPYPGQGDENTQRLHRRVAGQRHKPAPGTGT